MISKPFKTNFDLTDKVAVITGASSGIGLSTAKLFAQYGAKVCILDLNKDAADKVATSIPNSKSYFVNVADFDSVSSSINSILEDFKTIDILVNCAGIGNIEWAKDFEPSTWEKVLAVNLTGTFYMSQVVGKQMIQDGKGGKIISMASQAGIVAIDKHVAYSASKAGIISMTKSLAYEWGQYGIQVNAVSPTATETPIIEGYWTVGEVHDNAIANTPAGRFCKPEEIGMACVFLASDASNMITGENLVIDGGYTVH